MKQAQGGGIACGECGHEWAFAGVPPEAPPPGTGPCGAHIGGRPCPTPEAFTEAKRHWDAGCDHATEDCKVRS